MLHLRRGALQPLRSGGMRVPRSLPLLQLPHLHDVQPRSLLLWWFLLLLFFFDHLLFLFLPFLLGHFLFLFLPFLLGHFLFLQIFLLQILFLPVFAFFPLIVR